MLRWCSGNHQPDDTRWTANKMMFLSSSTHFAALLGFTTMTAAALAGQRGVGLPPVDHVKRIESTSRVLDVPATAPKGHQTVPANYVGYSVEFAYMADYAGNNS